MSSLLSIFLLLASLFMISTSSTAYIYPPTQNSKSNLEIKLKHIDSDGNFTILELLQRGMQRASRKKRHSSNITTPIHAAEEGDYLMDLSIGTPQRHFSAILDTGSDLIWTQCKPCQHCFKQPTQIFDPRTSPSYSNVTCSSNLCKALTPFSICSDGICHYDYTYGSGETEGVMSTETFHFGKVSVPRLGFGCSFKSDDGTFNGAGLVGLGRGELSLISQLHAPEFSYCLNSLDSKRTSILTIGGGRRSLPHHRAADHVTTTPLIKNVNPVYQSFYYLSLLGISVGETRLAIKKSAFRVREDGSGGTIIDSGTTLTYLNSEAFDRVKEEFIRQMKPLEPTKLNGSGLAICYELTAAEWPIKVRKMVFHFDGGDWELPQENFFLYDLKRGVGCLSMGTLGNDQFSIIGNVQQQNMEVVYDLEKETLSFMHTQCDHF